MTFEFRIILILASLLTATLILRRIRKSKARIEDSVFWILLSGIILLISLFPGIADAVTSALGIYLTTNFLFTFFIFLLLMKLFTLSIEVSQLKSKVEKLAQEAALANKAQGEVNASLAHDLSGEGKRTGTAASATAPTVAATEPATAAAAATAPASAEPAATEPAASTPAASAN